MSKKRKCVVSVLLIAVVALLVGFSYKYGNPFGSQGPSDLIGSNPKK